jgi:hypothetical protein
VKKYIKMKKLIILVTVYCVFILNSNTLLAQEKGKEITKDQQTEKSIKIKPNVSSNRQSATETKMKNQIKKQKK